MKRFSASRKNRRGATLVLTVVTMVVMLAMLGLAVDIGVLQHAQTDLQRTADSAALAAAMDLVPTPMPRNPLDLSALPDPLADLPLLKALLVEQDLSKARAKAKEFAQKHYYAPEAPYSLLDDDIVISMHNPGIIDDPPAVEAINALLNLLGIAAPEEPLYNAVQVTVRRDTSANDPVIMFFPYAHGHSNLPMTCNATAAIYEGYGVRPGARMLPFAVDVSVWKALRFGNGAYNATSADLTLGLTEGPVPLVDEKTWDRETQSVSNGGDGIWEAAVSAVHLGATGSTAGNLAALDIGAAEPSGPDVQRLQRQIGDGPSTEDFEDSDFSDNVDLGVLGLPFATTGSFQVPLQVQGDLENIIGQTRILPLYDSVSGTGGLLGELLGQHSSFQIVGWAAVVVTDVVNTPLGLVIKIQPAVYVSNRYITTVDGHPAGVFTDGVYAGPLLIE